MKSSFGKKCVLKRRSESKQTQAARRMLKINAARMALMNQAQTVSGRRGRVMPGARRSMVGTLKLSALGREAAQKMATLTIQREIAVWGERKYVVVRQKRDATAPQHESALLVVNNISRPPIHC